jgi:uncharacterized membrane protein YeaQ/YmgE (transglycosylase-associated protein family)
MNIIMWILFGLVAGAVAKLLMPGRDPGGWIITMLLGIAGAIVGGFIGRAVFGAAVGGNEFSFWNFIFAVGGAILLLAIYRMVVGRGRSGYIDSGRRAA